MLRTTASFTPPTTTNIANSRPAYSAQSQRQGLDLSKVEGTIRSHFETALGSLYEPRQRPSLEQKFESYLNRIKQFDDPFTAEWDPTDDRRLFIMNPQVDPSKPRIIHYFCNNIVMILEKLEAIQERLQILSERKGVGRWL